MEHIIIVILPLLITPIATHFILAKMFVAIVKGWGDRRTVQDNEHFVVRYPPVIRCFFAITSMAYISIIALMAYTCDDESAFWVYYVFGTFTVFTGGLFYVTSVWRVTVSGDIIKVRRPFHLTRQYSLAEIKGYVRTDDGGKIVSQSGKMICFETHFVQPIMLYNYFLVEKMILPPSKKKKARS